MNHFVSLPATNQPGFNEQEAEAIESAGAEQESIALSKLTIKEYNTILHISQQLNIFCQQLKAQGARTQTLKELSTWATNQFWVAREAGILAARDKAAEHFNTFMNMKHRHAMCANSCPNIDELL